MTNNCLVTKLKGTVNNDMLQRFGWHGIKVNMPIAGDFANPFTYSELPVISDVMIRGNAYFVDESGANLGKTGKNTFHHIHAEAGIFYLDWKDGSLSGFIYEAFFRNSNISVNAEEIFYIFGHSITFYNFVISGNGDISKLLKKITVINITQLYGNNLVSDIINVKPSNIISIAFSGITGTLESLFQKYASLINKTIKFEIHSNPGLTYQGKVAIFFHNVSFDGAGNYTFLD